MSSPSPVQLPGTSTAAREGIARRRMVERVAVGGCILALVVALAPLVHILYTAVTLGASKLSLTFFTQPAGGLPYVGTSGGVLNGIVGTSILLFIGGLVAVPVGVVSGVYLADFGHGRVGGGVRSLSDTLLGVPSVVWGLFGYIFFTNTVSSLGLRWDYSALSGGATLGLVMTPIIARVTELSLREVPLAMREASLALGATRWATMRRISLRVALPGIVTGVLLALTNAIGQTVALLLTNGYTPDMPHQQLVGSYGNVTDLGSLIYVYLAQPSPLYRAPAEATVVVLLALVLVLSLLSRGLASVSRRSNAR